MAVENSCCDGDPDRAAHLSELACRSHTNRCHLSVRIDHPGEVYSASFTYRDLQVVVPEER